MIEQFDAKSWEKKALAVWAAKEEAETKTPLSHWKCLIVVNFPSYAEDEWLLNAFVRMGLDIQSVSGKSLKPGDGKTNYAFVNCTTSAAAKMMKQACDDGRIEISDDSGRKWTLRADWAHGSRPTSAHGQDYGPKGVARLSPGKFSATMPYVHRIGRT